ncbi:PREDICTED: serrate RNA effector molecule-like [Tarenaya hassleriana]|uniref:serrate RNA effector molecule-like n=1 Tax=Tarenaya hassleriana TaxID=28532 RepID=UPI00053C17EE|nr:PREDICTED: serrate RNA effector molecule-like [Tarenaya hassleriana]XP_019059701.1 PREDICTED: serrate RNA effector molecule-like [Tarenaya hassleriana]XP_019059702.1 PREDICTED: serrate RNA effector molecule-like [Tarenaya hassleriana]
MADVAGDPTESVDRQPPEKSTSSPPPSPPASSSQPSSQQDQQPARLRERDSHERHNDRDIDRPPPNRHGVGDYYERDRDRERSPLPPPRREYKRRPSLSPPPYRDRRYSPPPRRSPPYKRRRDDNGHDGRRGSPRGGYGPPDRRFGYDYGGGYNREMGGRPGYPDDRPHGRYMGRYQDWNGGPGGYGDASNSGSAREGLMSYKQFIQELEDDVLPSEAEHRYQEYKSEFITTQKRVFFDAHKEEEWLKDKYHPTNLLSVIERRNELARKVAKDFLLDLQSGKLDLGPGVTALNKSGQTSEPNSEDEADGGSKRRRHARGPAKETDLLSAAPKAHSVSSDQRRVLVDIEQAQVLVRKLDSEKGIVENVLSGSDNEKSGRDKLHSGSSGPVIIIRGLTSVKGLEGVELLDTLVTYLWRVHGVDYYGMNETNEAKGLRHVRAEGKGSDVNGDEWEKKLDSHWQERLKGQDPMEVMAAKEKIDAAAVEVLDPYVRKIRDEKYGWKYGCGAKGCTKLFHAADFVHKHLKLKHPELVMELTAKVRDELYFQNYMNDPNAPGGQPVMQQQRDRPFRRKPGIESRLRDDRGRREREGQANGNDRFDQSDNHRPDDGDAPDGGNPDEAGYDAFGGPFSSDIPPPPVLMPVPGAGPLGPFVPAPPEVAMQMFRDQSGPPPPLEGSGRGGRSGPPVGGPAPFLLQPSFRQDPRRLRSYQDLDVPEEEVTVIDYRTL